MIRVVVNGFARSATGCWTCLLYTSHPDDVPACRETRLLAAQVDWPCEVKTLFRDANLGCRAAVSSAITWFFEHVEAGIILEDDCLPDLSFFPFCAELLEKYMHNDSVASISGDCFAPRRYRKGASYSFSKYQHIWGWATWKRAWKHFDVNVTQTLSLIHIFANGN